METSSKKIIQPLTEKQLLAPQRAGYYQTVWPSEHTDLWRSHAVSDVGLPAEFDHTQLSVTTAKLDLPVWGYTRAKDEVFVIGGSPATLDIFTEVIINGDADNSQKAAIDSLFDDPNILESLKQRQDSTPSVYKINPLTMQVTTFEMTEGTTLNYTGGLLMHQNGYVYAVSRCYLYKINPKTMKAEKTLQLPLLGEGKKENYFTVYNGLQVLASGELVIKGFYFLNSEPPVKGQLLLVDPDNLNIDVQQPHKLSSARMAIEQQPSGAATLYQVNATQALRFAITDQGFTLDNAWTRQYRTKNAGSTQASSQLLFANIGQVVFADNTVFNATTPIKLYTQSMNVADVPHHPLKGIDAFTKEEDGANFMMVAGDPFEQQTLVYYDPTNSLLSAHRVCPDGSLVKLWDKNGLYKASASPAIVPDRDLLYIDDYQNGTDHFVVLRLSTGKQLARVPLDANLPTIGTIFLGMNDDVYILSSQAGSDDGLISRIFIAQP